MYVKGLFELTRGLEPDAIPGSSTDVIPGAGTYKFVFRHRIKCVIAVTDTLMDGLSASDLSALMYVLKIKMRSRRQVDRGNLLGKYINAITMEASNATMDNNEYVFFWKPFGPYGEFSQWFYSPFTADGTTFATAEQYMMYKKAEIFEDHEMMSAIADSPSFHPAQHRKMGRSTKNFNVGTWNRVSLAVVAGVNYCKFTQNERLKSFLMSTGEKTLVEASPLDRTWGIGFDSTTAAANVSLWGENRLGKALMMVRDEILKSV